MRRLSIKLIREVFGKVEECLIMWRCSKRTASIIFDAVHSTDGWPDTFDATSATHHGSALCGVLPGQAQGEVFFVARQNFLRTYQYFRWSPCHIMWKKLGWFAIFGDVFKRIGYLNKGWFAVGPSDK